MEKIKFYKFGQMYRKSIKAVLIGIFLITFVIQLNATTYYVSLNGNDGWSGTEPDSTRNYSVIWYGKDNSGQQVSSGIYFYHINIDGNFNKTRIMVIIK